MHLRNLSFCSGLFLSIACARHSPDDLAQQISTPAVGKPLLADTPAAPHGLWRGKLVVEANGAAHYQLPLAFAPGRGGLGAELALSYDSNSGYGALGVGWRLDGMSMISRCPNTYAADQNLRRVRFDRNDRFCLDGALLVEVPPTNSQTSLEFRTERDSLVRVVAHDNGLPSNDPGWDVGYFQVYYPDGRLSELGNSASSKVIGPTAKARAWAVSSVRDRFGNFTNYFYTHWSAARGPAVSGETTELLISAIEYTGNDGSGGGLQLSTTRSVTFEYRDHTLPGLGFYRGGALNVSRRIVAIRGRIDGVIERSYELSYGESPATGRSLLTSISRCDARGTCLPAIRLEYGADTLTFSPAIDVPDAAIGALSSRFSPILADMDGDGRSDLVYQAQAPAPNGGDPVWQIFIRWSERDPTGTDRFVLGAPQSSGWFSESQIPGTIIDLDHDGRQDLLLLDSSLQRWRWLRSLGHSFEDRVLSPPAYPTDFFADVSGDGLADFASCLPDGYYQLRLNLGGGSFAPAEILSRLPCDPSLVSFDPSSLIPLIIDLQGDGAMELAAGTDVNVQYASAPNGTIERGLWTRPDTTENGLKIAVTADLNGDGLSDVLQYGRDAAGDINLAGWLSRGSGSFDGGASGYQVLGPFSPYFNRPVLADFNGDAKADVLIQTATALRVLPTRDINSPDAASRIWPAIDLPTQRVEGLDAFLGDIDGDGKTDIGYISGGNFRFFLPNSDRPDLLEVVREGTPIASYRVQYQALSNSDVYRLEDCVATYPTICVPGGSAYVVSHLEIDSGNEAALRFDYQYRNARLNLHGRGWLGFEKMMVRDHARRTTDEYEYDNFTYEPNFGRYPYRGMLLKHTREVYTAPTSGGLNLAVDVVENTLNKVSSGAVYAPYAETQRHTRWELNSAYYLRTPIEAELPTGKVSIQVDSVDAFGLVTSLTETHPEGRTVSRRISYDHDLQHWFIGRTKSTTITAVLPGLAPMSQHYSWDYFPNTGRLERLRTRAASDPMSLLQRFEYDTYGNLSAVSEENLRGEQRRVRFQHSDAEHMFPEVQTNAADHTTLTTYHRAHGSPRRIVDPNDEVVDFGYDTFGRIVSRQVPSGATTGWRFDAALSGGNALFRVESFTPGIPVVTTEYDRLGRSFREISSGFDGNPIQKIRAFDDLGRVSVEFEPFRVGGQLNGYRAFVFDERNRLRVRIDPGGGTWFFDYGLGQGAVAASGLETTGLSETAFDPNHQQTTTYFDGEHRLIKVRDAAGHDTTYFFDPFGRPRKIVDAAGNEITFQNDPYGLPLLMTDPAFGTRAYQHNAFGELELQLDSIGAATTFGYDVLGRLRTRTAAGEGSTEWLYDAMPGGANCSNPQVARSRADHAIGRLTCVSSSDRHTIEHRHDPAGRIDRTRYVVDGQTMAYNYTFDHHDRLESLIYPTSTDGRTFAVRYHYANGFLAQLSDTDSGFAYWTRISADPSGRTTDETYGNGVSRSASYDLDGRYRSLVSISPSHGPIQDGAFDHDYAGNLIGRRDMLQNMTERFRYDELDRLGEACFASGVDKVLPPEPINSEPFAIAAPQAIDLVALQNLGGGSSSGEMGPDNPDNATQAELWKQRARSPLETPEQAEIVRSAGLPLAENGARIGAQLSHHPCTTFRYDALGNILERSDLGRYDYPATVNGIQLPQAPSRVTTPAGAISFSFDENGRTRAIGGDRFEYSALGRLRSATSRGGIVNTRFEYAGDGVRAKKIAPNRTVYYAGGLFQRHFQTSATNLSQTLPVDTVTSNYLLAAEGRIIAEIRHHDRPFVVGTTDTRNYPWVATGESTPPLSTEALDEVASMPLEGSDSAQYYHQDHLGSVELVTDAAGAVIERRSYNPFGQLRSPDWSQGRAALPYGYRSSGFTGHEEDAELGLINMIGREYHPVFGRFLTPDPIIQAPTFSQSLNRYSYVWNNPLTLIDPTGYQAAPSDTDGNGFADITEIEGDTTTVIGSLSAGPQINKDHGFSAPTHYAWSVMDLPSPDRPRFRNYVALHYALQGNLKFALILERGHGCTGCHMTHFRNRVPTDDEIDLDHYDNVVNIAGYARVGTEIAAGAIIGASAGLEARLATNPAFNRASVAELEASLAARAEAAIAADANAARASAANMRTHSRYADGTAVLEGQQPARLSGPVAGAAGPHSALRFDSANRRVYQAREFDAGGRPVRDIDFTSPTFPSGRLRLDHAPPPHQHRWVPNDPKIGSKSGLRRADGERLQ